MNPDPSLESFSRFATEQYRSETKLWVWLFLVVSVLLGLMGFNFAWVFPALDGVLPQNRNLSVLISASTLFVFLCGLRLVSLFAWYFIIFWLLRWFPVLRKEKFSGSGS